MTKPCLPPELLHQLLRYEPDTGRLFWRERPVSMFEDSKHSAAHKAARWNARYAGKEALTADNGNGYRYGAIFDVHYKAHRVAWVMANGRWPDELIDHINGNSLDNRLCNLREATRSQNQWNAGSRGNSSIYIGVSWDNRRSKWKVQISALKQKMQLGSFDDEMAAAAAYDIAARKLHGAFAKVNFAEVAG